jgi:hypothetical protein
MRGKPTRWLAALLLSLAALGGLWAQTTITTDGLVESTSGGFKFPDGSIQETAVMLGVAPVADTGQQDCWDEAGAVIACAGSGQDGEHQVGVAWPSPRLVDNGDGTITDNMTGLMWLQEADCLSFADWEGALAKIDDFNTMSIACTNYAAMTYIDWRLPNVSEFQSLIDFGQADPALPAGSPFLDVITNSFYWTSTTDVDTPIHAWLMGMSNGETDINSKVLSNWIWAVRAGT